MITPCPGCESLKINVFVEGKDQELRTTNVGSSRTDLSPGRLLRCEECALCFRQLRPDDHQLASIYQRADDRVYEDEIKGRLRTALRHRDIVQKNHPRPGRLLDVGCASGTFLRVMAEAGWEIFGVEPSDKQFRRAQQALAGRGLVQHCTLQEADLPGDFDVITLWDVLEHVSEPVQFLRNCCRLLKKGGYLFVNVPNIDSLPARLLAHRWPLLVSEHLNYFNKRSMKVCGERADLTWVSFGQRPVNFSAGYVLYRLSQHGIPGAHSLHTWVSKSRLDSVTLPVWMGELLSVWRRPV